MDGLAEPSYQQTVIGGSIEERVAAHLDVVLQEEGLELVHQLTRTQAPMVLADLLHAHQHQFMFHAIGLGRPKVLIEGLSCNTK